MNKFDELEKLSINYENRIVKIAFLPFLIKAVEAALAIGGLIGGISAAWSSSEVGNINKHGKDLIRLINGPFFNLDIPSIKIKIENSEYSSSEKDFMTKIATDIQDIVTRLIDTSNRLNNEILSSSSNDKVQTLKLSLYTNKDVDKDLLDFLKAVDEFDSKSELFIQMAKKIDKAGVASSILGLVSIKSLAFEYASEYISKIHEALIYFTGIIKNELDKTKSTPAESSEQVATTDSSKEENALDSESQDFTTVSV